MMRYKVGVLCATCIHAAVCKYREVHDDALQTIKLGLSDDALSDVDVDISIQFNCKHLATRVENCEAPVLEAKKLKKKENTWGGVPGDSTGLLC